ncbi:histone-lysine N-methyltransferase, H3 lysine-36 specific-like [Ananas comosus]|uniref:Histone-lysine N-methyltransferase, H3 lysine-36 specific-like n=1 Tax=Ananas comosus TaxID=4615 RepID=A0A6P5HHF7_ANACO|nr:histone-lysine N-methyltransferase, H3 lysine-36 specific-like [Ananas comosus]
MVSLSSPPLSLSLPPPSPSPARRRALTLGFPHPRPPRPQNPELALLRRAPSLRIPDPAPFPGGSRSGLFGNGIGRTCSQSVLTCCYPAHNSWFDGIAAANEMVINGRIRNRRSFLVTVVSLRNLDTELQPHVLQDLKLQRYFTQDEHYQKVYFGKYDNEEFVDISANGESTSVLVTNTPDKLGLLATIFTVLHEWNITVESAEMHTCRGSAVNKFIISYQGLALTKEAAQDLTRELYYRVCIGE